MLWLLSRQILLNPVTLQNDATVINSKQGIGFEMKFKHKTIDVSDSFLILLFQTVTVHMTEEEMDNFVFAVLPKKTATKMQKELQDLVDNFLLSKANTLIFVMQCF